MRARWSAGGNCPAEGCEFAFGVESNDEDELDIIGASIMDTHSQRTHGGAPVTLSTIDVLPRQTAIDDAIEEDKAEAEGRPRLVN